MSTNGSSGKTSAAGRETPAGGFRGVLRTVALPAVVIGAVGSVALTLRVGQRNDSRILLALFTIWVLSPFVALVLADVVSPRWSVVTRATLHSLMLLLPLGSLAIYGNVAFKPPGPQPAFWFLAAPLGSWIVMALAIPAAALISRRRSRRGGHA